MIPLDLCDIFQNTFGNETMEGGVHPRCYTNTLVTYLLSRWAGDIQERIPEAELAQASFHVMPKPAGVCSNSKAVLQYPALYVCPACGVKGRRQITKSL